MTVSPTSATPITSIHGPQVSNSKQYGTHDQYILTVASHDKPLPDAVLASLIQSLKDHRANPFLGVTQHQAGASVKISVPHGASQLGLKRRLHTLVADWRKDTQA